MKEQDSIWESKERREEKESENMKDFEEECERTGAVSVKRLRCGIVV